MKSQNKSRICVRKCWWLLGDLKIRRSASAQGSSEGATHPAAENCR